MEKKLVLLDFDGVIADTFHIGHAVAQKICVFLTEERYRTHFDGNIYDAHDALTAADHGDPCDHALDWWAEYAPGFRLHAHPFDGMPETVRTFSKIYTLCVVSSSHDDLIAEFLKKYDLAEAIDGVYGVDLNTHKDEKFRMIFSHYGIEPRETVFVTDTLGDINEAASVDLSSIGVTWGFQDRATLERGKPFRIVDSPQGLPDAVSAYFAAN